MNSKELLKKYIYDQDNNFVPYGYNMWKSLLSSLVSKFSSLGFEEGYFYNQDLKEVHLNNSRYQMSNKIIDNNLAHVSISEYENMIEGAKTNMIDILQAYISTIKNVLSLNLISGKLISNSKEERYIIGGYIENEGFTKVGEVSFYEDSGRYKVYSYLKSNVIDLMVKINNDDRGLIVSPGASKHQVVIIPLKMNEANVLNKTRELRQKLESLDYSIFLDERKESDENKLLEALESGTPLILEVGPRDINNKVVELIKRTENSILSIDEDKVLSYISNFLKKVGIDLLNRQIKIFMNSSINSNNINDALKMYEEGKIINVIWDGKEESFNVIKTQFKNAYIYLPFNQELFNEIDIISKERGRYVLSICKKIL